MPTQYTPFSVLMSLYEREQPAFLNQCLSSLHAQTCLADEIVIVLDGNITPQLQAALDDWATRLPLRVLPLSHNVGLGKALNHGLAHCQHDWVFRMDTDDIATPHRFERQLAYLATHPNVALLGAQIAEFTQSPEQAHGNRRVPESHQQIQQFSQKRNPFNHMTIAYRKSAVQQAGGYQHHWFMEDYNLWLRMLAQNVQAANLPDVLVYARTGTNMVQRRRGWQYLQSEWQLYQLKRQLRLQAPLAAAFCLLQRTLPRLLPTFLLQHLYTWLRRT
ncbi:glycosyltransferase family 2 protein [Kingella kingae]|uniref:glycosyltransferase family 2 protein n=1 Tax=Kingella kingae TaxID=504 RepID=UPI0005C533A5|nr:glycosyltransferase [Kingella kingae]MDK4563596.1 glycosyltransferase [Kingella kingae]MDK4577839.1 glycosyltransferase [Kingella kingae]MDK4608210.1 glycosyltransferase [Kingella kingae]MDK4626896.1 glycosyltransferase [Kingella kingae]MDK4674648.1 glycosyltransferase [Kingella kingae]